MQDLELFEYAGHEIRVQVAESGEPLFVLADLAAALGIVNVTQLRARLSTRFVEWLMGLEDGHVTGEDLGLTREQQLRLLGNGVVPQQGAAAIYQLTKIAIKEAA
jgi:C-5 cytosine-specific DNA methylase|nr:MAG TPA: antirepressor [Caudoviricetes sp.]DAT85151.1 MAG TPA: antirepressor [Caudoviricetes sp.]